MKIQRIIIVRPHCASGGTLVLAALCRLLRDRGIDARLFDIYAEPKRNTILWKFWLSWIKHVLRFLIYPLWCRFINNPNSPRYKIYHTFLQEKPIDGLKFQWNPFFSRKNTVVVYPERVYGNFLKARYVVRWLLYYNPYTNDEKAYGKDDLVIAFRSIFNDEKLNPKGYQLQISWFNNQLYRQYNYGKREGNCYIIRKGANRNDLPTHFDGPIIDDFSEEEKVHVLNKCAYCYSYDLQTFYSAIAAVCGCLSIVVLEPGRRKEDYYSVSELETVKGIALGDSPEERRKALATRSKLLESLNFTERNRQELDTFLTLLQTKFG
jgi:hypothetical protein